MEFFYGLNARTYVSQLFSNHLKAWQGWVMIVSVSCLLTLLWEWRASTGKRRQTGPLTSPGLQTRAPDPSIRKICIPYFFFCLRPSLIIGAETFIRVRVSDWWPFVSTWLIVSDIVIDDDCSRAPASLGPSLRLSEMAGLYSGHTLHTRVNYDGVSV